MGFSKSDEYIDYTLLKKKGILKLPEEKKLSVKTEGGFVDFTAFGSTENTTQTAGASAESPAGLGAAPAPNFDFLGNMASVGASSAPSAVAETPAINPFAGLETFAPSTPATSVSQISGNVDGREMNAVKLKIDDMEYKLDKFIERLDKLEEKLGKLNLG